MNPVQNVTTGFQRLNLKNRTQEHLTTLVEAASPTNQEREGVSFSGPALVASRRQRTQDILPAPRQPQSRGVSRTTKRVNNEIKGAASCLFSPPIPLDPNQRGYDKNREPRGICFTECSTSYLSAETDASNHLYACMRAMSGGTRLNQKHMLLLGPSGSGKSYLIEQIIAQAQDESHDEHELHNVWKRPVYGVSVKLSRFLDSHRGQTKYNLDTFLQNLKASSEQKGCVTVLVLDFCHFFLGKLPDPSQQSGLQRIRVRDAEDDPLAVFKEYEERLSSIADFCADTLSSQSVFVVGLDSQPGSSFEPKVFEGFEIVEHVTPSSIGRTLVDNFFNSLKEEKGDFKLRDNGLHLDVRKLYAEVLSRSNLFLLNYAMSDLELESQSETFSPSAHGLLNALAKVSNCERVWTDSIVRDDFLNFGIKRTQVFNNGMLSFKLSSTSDQLRNYLAARKLAENGTQMPVLVGFGSSYEGNELGGTFFLGDDLFSFSYMLTDTVPFKVQLTLESDFKRSQHGFTHAQQTHIFSQEMICATGTKAEESFRMVKFEGALKQIFAAAQLGDESQGFTFVTRYLNI